MPKPKPTKPEADGFESAEIWDEHTYRRLRDELRVNREELEAQHAQLVESRREVELSRDEYVELFDIGPIACFILDGNGVIWRSNLAGADLVGSEPARLRQSPLLVFVVESDRRIWLDHLRRCRRSDAAVSTELTIRTRGGVEILVELTSRAFSAQRDHQPRYYTSVVDLRERQRIENERRRVSEERRRIEQERAVARADSASKDRFIAILSHELRTPLMPILLATATWKDDATLSNPLRQALTMIHRNITVEARLIDDLLDLTRITQNKLVVRIDDVAIHDVIDQVVQALQSDVDAAGLTLTLDLRAPGTVRADPVRLSQIVWNLTRNAIRFTDPGGRITVETRNTTPTTTTVTVTDTGIGFAPHESEHFFEAFDQGPESARRGGLGLGLAIVKGLVIAHGGTITAASDGLGTGARFSFDLPTSAERPTPVAVPPDAAPVPMACAPLTVLLVEDHEDSAIALSYVLQQHGYAVQLAHSVTEALATASSCNVDVIVSDVGLPDGSGLDLLRTLRAQKPVRGIALTGYGRPEDVDQSRAAGFEHHLVKPVDLPALVAAIESLRPTSA